MVERIRTLIQNRELSTTQFADAIGVARPVVSHILSGRNKASLEVFQKILAAFPELSTDWLLNGTGPMQVVAAVAGPRTGATPAPGAAQAVVAAPIVAAPATVAPPVAVAPPATASPAAATQTPPAAARPNGTPSPPAAAPAAPTPSATTAPEPPPGKTLFADYLPENQIIAPILPLSAGAANLLKAAGAGPEAETPATPPAAVIAGLGTGKAIRRIVIFYRDGSFADYQPE